MSVTQLSQQRRSQEGGGGSIPLSIYICRAPVSNNFGIALATNIIILILAITVGVFKSQNYDMVMTDAILGGSGNFDHL